MSDKPQKIALYQKVKNEAARKRLNIKAAFFWCTSKKESLALSRMALAMDEAGFDDEDFARPIRVNLPVIDDLPEEGVFDTAFCDRYQLGDDGMTFCLIPGTTPITPAGEKIVEGTDTTIVDGVDTETGEIIQHDQVSTEDNGDRPEHPQLTVVATMPFRHRVLAQHIGDGEYLYHVDAEQKKAILDLEIDTDNSYVQNLLLAAENVEPFKKAIEHDIHKVVNAVKTVFPVDGKIPELATVIQFLKTWFDTPHIDRGLLVKEWCKGNRVSAIQRTESGANAGGGIASDRKMPQTTLGLEFEIALGLLARQYEFDIYSLPLQIELKANSIMNAVDDPEWLATRELFVSMPGGLGYSRACIIATVKTTPDELYKAPFRHREYLNKVLTETDHANPDPLVVDIACGRSSMPMPTPVRQDEPSVEEVNQQLAAARGDYVEGISDPNDPKWVHEDYNAASNEGEKTENGDATDVQVQETDGNEEQTGDALLTSESDLGNGEEADTGEQADVGHNQLEVSQNNDSVDHSEPEAQQNVPETQQEEPASVWPEYFEPGRYEGMPNDVYHKANGISSTMLKDARISLMYYNGRHNTGLIPRQDSQAFIFGRVTHSFVLEPEKFSDEYAVPAEMPKNVVSTSGDMVAIIKEYNASLPALMTPGELKAWIEDYNSNLTPPLILSGSADETANLYVSLPEEFQRIQEGTKPTASAMKACIKEYNATLPPMLKTSGTRDQLLDQISTVAPEFAEQERAKFIPYNISGTKEQLTEIVRAIRPDVMLADDWHKQQEAANAGKTVISQDMYDLVKNINDALQADEDASWLLNHPDRKSEVSYFGFDEETGIELRVRPDIEIRLPPYLDSICADLKTIGLGFVPQDRLKARLHREIIERGYHISAAMYCDVAALDTFAWIFVNKDPGYHWVAVVYAPPEMLELGRKEYRRLLQQINEATFSGKWPAPIVGKYVDELSEYDINRLTALEDLA